jgi:hypothetical protein
MLVLGLVAALFAESALAHGGYRGYYGPRTHFGVFIGAPAFWYSPFPYYHYPPAYYYPPYYPTSPAAPTAYIERPQAQPESERAQDYWYYCPEAQAYYPYVKQCAKGWQRVAPQPQN